MKKNNNYFEIIVGTFVLLSACFFLFNSFKNVGIKKSESYKLIAKFDNIGDIAIGSDIKISGVKIGVVEEQFLDNETYRATLVLTIKNSVKLPSDSSIKISSEGLLGSKFLAIEPGSQEEFLKNGEEIEFTQSSVNFEELLGKFIFNSENSKKENSKKDEKK
jgi:phospholipid/cholesterol/gamma-HCH transport system substrate-binding protein